MDFTSLNPGEISWIIFGLLLAAATFAYPYVRTKLIQSMCPEYSEREITTMLNKFWEKIFIISAVLVAIFINYYIVKIIFWIIHTIGSTYNILGVVSFTTDNRYGLAVFAIILGIEAFFYIFARMKKAKQNREKAKHAKEYSDDNIKTIDELEMGLERLNEDSQRLKEMIDKLKGKQGG